MRSTAVRLCKALALLGSVLIHALFLIHSGFGNSGPIPAQPESGLLTVNFIDAPKLSDLCGYLNDCSHVEPNKKAVEANNDKKNGSQASQSSDNLIDHPIQEQSFALGTSYYFHRAELSDPPVILTNPHIHLPEGDDPRIIGSVQLRLFLSEEGQIDDLLVLKASLPLDYVDAIMLGYKNVSFSPGQLNGRPVKSQIDFEINFTSDQTQLPMLRQNH